MQWQGDFIKLGFFYIHSTYARIHQPHTLYIQICQCHGPKGEENVSYNKKCTKFATRLNSPVLLHLASGINKGSDLQILGEKARK